MSQPADQDQNLATSVLACERCCRRKQACDRQLPVCSRCRQAGATCIRTSGEISMTRSRNGGVQRKSAVALLQERLASLKALAREHDNGLLNSSRAADAASDAVAARQDVRDARLGQGGMELSLGLLSLGAMSEPTRRAGEVLPELSFPRIICAATEIYGGNPEYTQRMGAMWDGIAKNIRNTGSNPQDRFVVPRVEALKYLDAYFDTVDFRYPRLSREDTAAGFDAISSEDDERFANSIASSPAHVFMAYMVTAIVPLISESHPGAQASFIGIHMLSQALKILDKVFQLEDGIDIIQCLRLLVIFSLHSSTAGSSWHLVSFAMKKCVALGFHREIQRPNSRAQRHHLEQRRWAFWSCYLLDRLICTGLSRPYSISDKYITVKFPGEDPDVAGQISPAETRQIHLYRYAVLMSEVFEDRGRKIFSYHLSHLLHWRASVPDRVEPYPFAQSEHLQSLYHTLLLRITIDQITYEQRRQSENTMGSISSWTPQSNDSPGPRYLRTPGNGGDLPPKHHMKLLATCHAVVKSLNRASMKHRSVLSWITGYSAASAALGLLFWIAAQGTGQGSSSLSSTNPVDQATQTATEAGRSVACDEILEGALSVLSTVGRQFSRMGHYHRVIHCLRSLIRDRVDAAQQEQMDEVAGLVADIRVDHLRILADECLALGAGGVRDPTSA